MASNNQGQGPNNAARNPNVAVRNNNRGNNGNNKPNNGNGNKLLNCLTKGPNNNRGNNTKNNNARNGNSAMARARGKSLAEQAQSQGYAMAQRAHEQALAMVQQAQAQALEKAKQVAIARGLQFNANVPTNYLDSQGRRIMQGANGGSYVNTSSGRNYKPTPAFLNQMGTNVVSQVAGNPPNLGTPNNLPPAN